MQIRCNINVKHNFKNINKIIQELPQTISDSLEAVLNNMRGYAIKLEKGQNEEGIKCELIDTSTKEVKGRVYADPDEFMSESNISYLWFEYFGTGSNAEMEHVGKSKHFIESGFTEWFIPVSSVSKQLKFPIVNIQGQDFYISHGNKANHFLTDGEFQSREENKEIFANKLKEMIKECTK